MNEEELRQKKIEEWMAKTQEKQEQESNNEMKINQILNKFLTEEAKSRLNNVRIVKKELFQLALQSIIYSVQQGAIREKISDSQIKSLLEKLSEKKEINIRRK